nr:MAG TPA: hypothetical protein [Bacteriophage sp.]
MEMKENSQKKVIDICLISWHIIYSNARCN